MKIFINVPELDIYAPKYVTILEQSGCLLLVQTREGDLLMARFSKYFGEFFWFEGHIRDEFPKFHAERIAESMGL